MSAARGTEVRNAGRVFLPALRLDRSPATGAREDPREGVAEGVREAAREALAHGVGGFLIFGGSVAGVRALIGELRAEADRPLWFAADLERGAGQQFEGAPVVPPPRALAAHRDPEEAVRRAARSTARHARAIGVNWVMAPVLDLDAEAANPIVGTRSFGDDPERVGRLGRVWIETCRAEGVAACAKHFPGHGRTTADSHLRLPTVPATREELQRDLVPFRAAVQGGVTGVMTAHVRYPALGERPATLEPAIVDELLRGELGFEGLVVTDALGMSGLREAGSGAATEGWLAVRALRAGCDLALYPLDLARSVRTVKQAAEQDPRLRASLDASVERSEARLARLERAAQEGATGPGRGGSEPSPEAGSLLEETIVEAGDPPGVRLDRSRPVRLVVLDDDAYVDGGAEAGRALARAVAETLAERGWDVRGTGAESGPGEAPDSPAPDPDGGPVRGPGAGAVTAGGCGFASEPPGPGPDGGGDPREADPLVLLVSTPRAGKGRAGPREEARSAARRILAGERGYLLLFGHARELGALGPAGACAWTAEPEAGRAAARWLHARAG